jgi:hypothetical protein
VVDSVVIPAYTLKTLTHQLEKWVRGLGTCPWRLTSQCLVFRRPIVGCRRKKNHKFRGEIIMAKKQGLSLMAGAAVLLCSAVSQAAVIELAVNGGFETGDFSGWTQFPGSLGASGQSVVSGNASTGGFSARLTEPAPAANIIKQANLYPGAFTPGQTIFISFDYRGTASAGGVLFAELFSELSGGGTSSSVILGGGPLFPNANPNTWTSVSFQGVAGPDTSGGITLQLNAACGAGAGCIADYFVDNISVMADVAPVPVPAAAWLFATGILGLVARARRRLAA